MGRRKGGWLLGGMELVVVLVLAMAAMMLDGDDDEQRREEDCGTQPEVRCSPLAPACACDWVGSRHCAGLCSAVPMCRPGKARAQRNACVWTMMDESSGRE